MAGLRQHALCFCFCILLFVWVCHASDSHTDGHGDATTPSDEHHDTGSDNSTHSEDSGGHSEHGGPITTLPIVSWKWHHVEDPYIVTVWILVCWLCKLVIEANHHVTSVIPESALLICFGFILGGIVWGADKVQTFSLTPTVFFFYLLPQIILDAGYFMPNKLFFSNLGGILMHAVIGTCWNAATVGLSLWGCHMGGAMGDIDVGLLQYLLFGSLIAAVDPVAVIAVFEEVHVNEVLFIMVFGESLLNDGVTVVLFNVFDAFVSLGGSAIDAVEIIKGIISFFVVAFGGALVGVIFGIMLSLLTRCTKNIQIIEPGFVFVLGYLSYLTAEMLSLSAILSITFCGVCCQKYINANMDEKSVTTVRYVMKVFANGSETMIFVFLGITAIDKTIWVWNTGFILLTLLFVLVYRCIGVFFLTWVQNKFRLVPLDFMDRIIMSYGGLRGAVAYGLAGMLDGHKIKEKPLMVGTTLIVVYFTVIFQGITMKPLVTWLKVKRAANTELTLVEKVQNKVFDHMLVAIEDISGQKGHNYMRDKWKHFEEKWLSWILMKPSARKKHDYVFNVFHKLNLRDALDYVAEGESKGTLDFVRNETAYVDFKKKFGDDFSDISMPDITIDMGDTTIANPYASSRRDTVPSISLEMHEQTMNGLRESEDINTHHLLQQHLYKGRKQHRHRYSRSHFDVNQDENEVQEIFQRTMRNRLESFKSAKMGVAPPKTITKHPKKDSQQKMANGKSMDKTRSYHSGDEDFEFSEGDSASGYTGYFPRATYRTGAGIENPAFMPDIDPTDPVQIPPWLAEGEPDSTTGVAPSQRAQTGLPWTPSNLRRLAPLRISTRSTDSFMLADIPTSSSSRDSDELPPPPSPPSS